MIVPESVDYVVTEKIHGANMSIYVRLVDGELKVQFARRNGFLNESDHFFNFQSLQDDLTDKALALHDEIGEDIIIYGELFGKFDGTQINKGVYYGEDLLYYPFDIYIVNRRDYMPALQAINLFKQFGFNEIPIVQIGKFDEVISFDVKNFKSLIVPDYEGDNYAEGVVIKPNTSYYTEKGERVIIKKKHPQFDEIIGKGKNRKIKDIKIETFDDVPEFITDLGNDMLRYITENRLNNVLSKYTEEEKANNAKMVGMFVQDVWKEYNDDNDIPKLKKKEKKYINNIVRRECIKIYQKSLN